MVYFIHKQDGHGLREKMSKKEDVKMANMVRWNIAVLNNSINSMNNERNNLEAQRRLMEAQRARVDVNWQSPAGRQYQARLRGDMATISHIIQQLDRRLTSLRRVLGHYRNAEDAVRRELNRLPR